MHHHFGVGAGAETVTAPFKLFAESPIVVDLPVEHDADRVVLIENRLMSAGEVDNGKAAVPEGDLVIQIGSGVIRAAMSLRLIHGAENPAGLGVGMMIDDSGNPAHLQNSPGL